MLDDCQMQVCDIMHFCYKTLPVENALAFGFNDYVSLLQICVNGSIYTIKHCSFYHGIV